LKNYDGIDFHPEWSHAPAARLNSEMQIDIDHLSLLARVSLTSSEKIQFSAQIADILGYIEKLKKVNIDGIEPTAHGTPILNVFQTDVPQLGLTVEYALRNAPAQSENMIHVPRIVE
jgi:aspartyl-tRNA(Asn)/glutamyl-tRNA(Gln) amidotransferase subunit C